ncbi:MAG: TrkH family potassium uptake protein [Puniceicoccaceae bacterium]|nr:MAG: TrkH family potassium uptake protein [Puniceicoccaceae bacterium]
MNTAIIYRLLSMVLLALAAGFALCTAAGFFLGESLADDSIRAFLITIAVSLTLAGLFHWLGRQGEAKLFRREALCAIGLSWILATLVGALPYGLTETGGSWADAVFESASGLTTTGATAYHNFYEFPQSLLLWRSLSQWIGGLGVVVFFVAILSSLGAGAKILFSNESTGTSSDFDQGRIQSGAFQLMLLYLGLSLSCLLAYKLGGMDWFQAVNHTMTTVSTGGFSTEAMSLGQFQSPMIEWTAIVFMILCGTTFVYIIRLLRGQTHILRQNSEVYWFVMILLVTTAMLTLFLVDQTGELPSHDSIRTAAFQATSIITTTGYATADFSQWLPPATMTLLVVMFIGGCSGSTSGGIKVVRIVIAVRAALRSITHAFRPNVTIPMRMGGQTLNERAIHSVVLFIVLMVVLQLLAMLFVAASEPELSFTGVFSSVQSTLFNIGPGFAEVGPNENFQFLRSSTKLFLSLLMILGRLELYAVLVLFIPATWKRFS